MVFKPTTFGKYVLLKRIAIGGMAEVFRAKAFGAEGFEKLAAVKRMLPHLSSDSQFVEMFINEAKLAAALNHANIAQIYDFGCIDKLYFLSMEYVHGKDIADIIRMLRERNLQAPIEMACFLFIEVLNGLDYAHRLCDPYGQPLGLIHRDMSPHNIIVSYEGEVKLVDFGIAKAASNTVHTTGGVLKGKYSYMSPEQAHGVTLDHRSDLFSLGICFYELLTQTKMFHAESDLGVLEKVRETAFVPPRQIDPSIPSELEDILLKALEKNPEDRYESAAQFRDRLEQFLFERNLHYSTSWLAGFMREVFADELAREGREFAEEAAMVQKLRSEARRFARLADSEVGPDTVVLHKTPSGVTIDEEEEDEEEDTVAETREVELPVSPGWQPVNSEPEGPLVVGDDDVIALENIEQQPADEEYLPTAKLERPDQQLFEKVTSLPRRRPPIREVPSGQDTLDDTFSEGELDATTDRRARALPDEFMEEIFSEGLRTGERPLLVEDFEKDRSTLSEDGRGPAGMYIPTEKSGIPLADEKPGFPFGKVLGVLLLAAVAGGLLAYFGSRPDSPETTAAKSFPVGATSKPVTSARPQAPPAVDPSPPSPAADAGVKPVATSTNSAGPVAPTPQPTAAPEPKPEEKPAPPPPPPRATTASASRQDVSSTSKPSRRQVASSNTRRRRPKRHRARKLRSRPSGKPATITVGLTEGWAHVYIDGKRIRTTPLLNYKIAAGRHVIELKDRTGRLIKRQPIRARPGAKLRFVW